MSNRPGYKHTPLGWIPEEWEIHDLGECCIIKGEYGINAPAVSFSINLPTYLRITDIDDDGNFKASERKSVNDKDALKYVLCSGDIVFARTGGTVGKTYLHTNRNGSLVFAGFLIRFRTDKSKLFPNYLKYHTGTKRYWDWVKVISMRSGQPGINGAEYCLMPIIVPPVSEQCKISSTLSLWDEAITKAHQLIAQLQQRNKGLKQQLLTGKKRLKGYNKPWGEIHLAEAFNERNETGFVNLDLLSVGSLGVYPQSQSEKRDTSNSDKAKYKRICAGDIGYNTMRMWQGRSALSSLEGIVSPAYTIVTPKKRQHSEFYAYLFKLPSVVNKFFRNSQGLVEDTLNCKFKDFAIVKVEVPEYEEQVAIANVLTTAQSEIKSCEQKLMALQQQKTGLMQKLLTGEVRVKIEE